MSSTALNLLTHSIDPLITVLVSFSCHGTNLEGAELTEIIIGRAMTEKTTAILALNLVFGAILLCRVGFQLYKRNEIYQRYNRVPSSATSPTLTFDASLGLFLIAVSLLLFY